MPEAESIKSLRTGFAVRALEVVHLLRPAYRVRRRLRTLRYAEEDDLVADGLPVPPARLRFLVGDNADAGEFVEGGRLGAELIEARLRAAGIAIDSLDALLDFGCGCGRIARHWASLSGPEIHGCDANPKLAEWCDENLPFCQGVRNDLEPPLPYVDGAFDLIYAFSVLTHLPPSVGEAWVAEFRRLLRPTGVLMVTHHGDRHAAVLSGPQREAYDAGRPVVLRESLIGTNGCGTFAPPSYVRGSLLGGFEILDFAPADDTPGIGQDLYLARPNAG